MRIKGTKTDTVVEIEGEELEQFADIARKNKLVGNIYLKIIGMAKSGSDENFLLSGEDAEKMETWLGDYNKTKEEIGTQNAAREDLEKMLEEAQKTVEMLIKNIAEIGDKIKENKNSLVSVEESVQDMTKIPIDAWAYKPL